MGEPDFMVNFIKTCTKYSQLSNILEEVKDYDFSIISNPKSFKNSYHLMRVLKYNFYYSIRMFCSYSNSNIITKYENDGESLIIINKEEQEDFFFNIMKISRSFDIECHLQVKAKCNKAELVYGDKVEEIEFNSYQDLLSNYYNKVFGCKYYYSENTELITMKTLGGSFFDAFSHFRGKSLDEILQYVKSLKQE